MWRKSRCLNTFPNALYSTSLSYSVLYYTVLNWSVLAPELRICVVSLIRSVCYSYAITVWYFDAKERAEAKEKYRLGELQF